LNTPSTFYRISKNSKKVVLKPSCGNIANGQAAVNMCQTECLQLSCDPCSDIELDKLDSISNIIGSENVFLLSKNSSFKDIYLLRRINSFRFRVALVDELINLPISNYPSNYYFVLDSNYVIKLFFVPVRKNQDLNELYYSQIIKQFDKVPVGT